MNTYNIKEWFDKLDCQVINCKSVVKKNNKSFAFSDQYCMDEGAINNICRKSSGKNFHSVIL